MVVGFKISMSTTLPGRTQSSEPDRLEEVELAGLETDLVGLPHRSVDGTRRSQCSHAEKTGQSWQLDLSDGPGASVVRAK